MNKMFIVFLLSLISSVLFAQHQLPLSTKGSVGVSTNIETYFFAEKLAVEHIGNYVFDIKGVDYSHQPIVYFGFKHFSNYQNDPVIIRAAEILKEIRDTLHDNGPIFNYLLNQKEFPGAGPRFALKTDNNPSGSSMNKNVDALLAELTDSLRSFYVKADVGRFLAENSSFYKQALQEIGKDINKDIFLHMEKWYGQKFPFYELYISPAMPITPGDDNYRGVGPQIDSPKGKIPSMVVSSSKMLKLQNSLADYHEFGFDNEPVTSFISSHEIGHSFVNPLLDQYTTSIKADSALYTKKLEAILSTSNIRGWHVTVIEHLVRLGEIRIAVSVKNDKEAERLRKLHIGEYNCVLIPLLEAKIIEYERNHKKYPDFKSYVPVLMAYFQGLTPEIIDEQVRLYVNY
ncbi:DUF4932 domain-containing protein [Pedobacter antarcticus]|uniref:DUF4932 domain-containing protein n=1 Tax=Pedobacter antarcticus TaxID=34086 RepID=UPI000890CE0A|nr:DUF4932 domain-containing protein [Pedobacter antarcticus]SDM30387.1 protein of unknown function [Pedobacter antarcticus]